VGAVKDVAVNTRFTKPSLIYGTTPSLFGIYQPQSKRIVSHKKVKLTNSAP